MSKKEFDLDIALPNGIILLLIGVLVLLTPFFTQLDKGDLFIDLCAGFILFAGGAVSLIKGLGKRRKQI